MNSNNNKKAPYKVGNKDFDDLIKMKVPDTPLTAELEHRKRSRRKGCIKVSLCFIIFIVVISTLIWMVFSCSR